MIFMQDKHIILKLKMYTSLYDSPVLTALICIIECPFDNFYLVYSDKPKYKT